MVSCISSGCMLSFACMRSFSQRGKRPPETRHSRTCRQTPHFTLYNRYAILCFLFFLFVCLFFRLVQTFFFLFTRRWHRRHRRWRRVKRQRTDSGTLGQQLDTISKGSVLHCTAFFIGPQATGASGGQKCGTWCATNNTQMWKHSIVIRHKCYQIDPMVSNECSNTKHKSNITTSGLWFQYSNNYACSPVNHNKEEYVGARPNSSHYGVQQVVWRLSHWYLISKSGPPLKQ